VPRNSRRSVALLGALLSAALPACTPADPAPHGIVLVVIDTLRPDRLTVYGHERDTSPALARIAAGGVVFEQAISNSSWTLPAFMGLLSGSYPDRPSHQRKLGRSLVETLRASGRATAAFTEGGYVSASFGLDRGFDRFTAAEAGVRLFSATGKAAPAQSSGVAQTFDGGLAWLREHAGAPFFLLLHTYEVHMPYRHRDFAEALDPGSLPEHYTLEALGGVKRGERPVGATETRYVQALYDGGIRAVDEQVGRLDALLAELDLTDRTLLIVTSDHGEELGERAPERLGVHGAHLYDTLLRIPLILRYPNGIPAGGRISTQVRLVDVLPTALDFAGVAVPDGLDGRSLRPLLEGGDAQDRPAFAEIYRPNSDAVGSLTLRDGGFKLIVNVPPLEPGEPAAELYDVASDPGERDNRAERDPARKDALQGAIRAQRERNAAVGVTTAAPEPSDQLREQLRALGYVE
jgi:arylsulfatase A-like enzyme